MENIDWMNAIAGGMAIAIFLGRDDNDVYRPLDAQEKISRYSRNQL
jgi:hypothetical protein